MVAAGQLEADGSTRAVMMRMGLQLSAITKTMRIRACLIRRQVRILLDHGVPAMQENSLDPENPKAVINENLQ